MTTQSSNASTTPTTPSDVSASGNTFIHRHSATGERFVIYKAQSFHGCGHCLGHWYAKPAGSFPRLPVTNGYHEAAGAIGAIDPASGEERGMA